MPAQSPARDAYEFDVFISYSHDDEIWVTTSLLPRLEAANLKVLIDFRDFVPGKPVLHNIRDAVKRSRRTLFVMTPRWVESEWAEYESILVRTSDPVGRRQRTVALLVQPCDVPEDIALLTYIDLTRADRTELAWRQVLTAFGAPPEPAGAIKPSRERWLLAHPYGMLPHFTGREVERRMLSAWLGDSASPPLFILRALGGFGKSALTWQWMLHDVEPDRWPRLMWWSFYQPGASFEQFVAAALRYFTRRPVEGAITREHGDAVLEQLRMPGTLVVFDGFERALRGYGGADTPIGADTEPTSTVRDGDGLSLLVDMFLRALTSLPNLRGRVLMSTRLRPSAVEFGAGVLVQGCREYELTELRPADAVELFRASGIRGTALEITTASERYGYHALSLRLLAGLIVSDPEQPGDIQAASRLDVSGEQVHRQHHVLQRAYDSLSSSPRALLSTIACVRGAVTVGMLSELALVHRDSLSIDLRELLRRGLIHRDPDTNRLDLHPIVRRYAYDRLDDGDRRRLHDELRRYFVAIPAVKAATTLDDIAPVVELYHHTVRTADFDAAYSLYRDRLSEPLTQLGAYQLECDLLRQLFIDDRSDPPKLRLAEQAQQVYVLDAFSRACAPVGRTRDALRLMRASMMFHAGSRNKYDRRSNAQGWASIAGFEQQLGKFKDAEKDWAESVRQGRAAFDEDYFDQIELNLSPRWLAGARQVTFGQLHLGLLQALTGRWEDAAAAVTSILEILRPTPREFWSFHVRFCLMLARQRQAVPAFLTTGTAKRLSPQALALRATRTAGPRPSPSRKTPSKSKPSEWELAEADWLTGAVFAANGDAETARRHLDAAVSRCRRTNIVDLEAVALIELARLRLGSDNDEARRLAETALMIADRMEAVLAAADAHLVLASIGLSTGEKDRAKTHAQAAQQLAFCDGPPNYTYRAAHDEATAILTALAG